MKKKYNFPNHNTRKQNKLKMFLSNNKKFKIVLLQNPILKELGVQEWEIHNPDFRKFYEWLDNNITAENILTEEEKESYDTIPPDERLEGVALQQEMDRIEKKYPGVMDVTPELLERTNEKAAQLADTLAVYQKIADDLQ